MTQRPDDGRNYGGPSPIGGAPTPAAPPPSAAPPLPPIPPGPVGPPLPPPVIPPAIGPGADPWQQPLPRRGNKWWQDPKRKPLVWTVGAGAALVVIVAIILGFTMIGRGSGPSGAAGQNNDRGSSSDQVERSAPSSAADPDTKIGPAGELVKSYLEALARGDAQAALAASDVQPGSTEFLTDDILKQQIAKWPITKIQILSDDTDSPDSPAATTGPGLVRATATFGTKVSETFWEVHKQNGQWRLKAAAVKVAPNLPLMNDAVNKTLMLFGKPFTSPAYVFPGWIDLTSSNPYIALEDGHGFLPDTMMLDSSTGTQFQDLATVNDAGRKAVDAAVAADLASCQSSNRFAPPPPCPVSIRNRDGDLVDGTVKWGQADVSQLIQTSLNPNNLGTGLTGSVSFPVSAQQRGGDTTNFKVTEYLAGEVDLNVTPLKLTWG